MAQTDATSHTRAASPNRTALVLAFLCIYVVWGSTYLAIRFGLESIPPFMLGGMRFLVAGGALFGWARWRGAPAPSRVEWRNAALIGALLLFCGNGAVSWSEQRVSSGMTSLLVASVPIWIVLCEVVMGQRPRLLKWIGVIIGLLGVGLLVMPTDGDFSHMVVDPMGALVLTGGSLAWAVGSLYARRATLPSSAALASGMQMLVGGTMLIGLAAATGQLSTFASRVADGTMLTSALLGLCYLIVFGSVLGFSTYVWLVKVASPTAVGTYAYVNPVVAVLLGMAILSEPLPKQALLATMVIVTGLVLVSLDGRRR